MQVWGDLPKRALTAAILGPMALLCVWLGSYWWTALMAVCVAGLAWEWVRLCGGSTRKLPGAIVPGAVLLACGMAVQSLSIMALFVLALGAILIFLASPSTYARKRLSWYAFGLVYIGLAGVSLIDLRHSDVAGRNNILFLLAIVWASDMSAYAFGRLLGGPKLAPSISPNKTWAGAGGGLLGAAMVGFVVAVGGADSDTLAIVRAMCVAAVLGVATQIGDLFESWIKRQFGVKDSSRLIPGHGGLLDRLDGVLAAAPVAVLLSLAAGSGNQLWR